MIFIISLGMHRPMKSEMLRGAGTGAETDEGQPISESKKVTEIVGAAHIPTPEERLLKEERRAEMSKIIAKATAKLTDKQAEVYKLHIEYGYSLERTSEMLGLPRTTASGRFAKVRTRFSEELRKQTGEDAREYFGENAPKDVEVETVNGINDSDNVENDSGGDNFEDEIDESDESIETAEYR